MSTDSSYRSRRTRFPLCKTKTTCFFFSFFSFLRLRQDRGYFFHFLSLSRSLFFRFFFQFRGGKKKNEKKRKNEKVNSHSIAMNSMPMASASSSSALGGRGAAGARRSARPETPRRANEPPTLTTSKKTMMPTMTSTSRMPLPHRQTSPVVTNDPVETKVHRVEVASGAFLVEESERIGERERATRD